MVRQIHDVKGIDMGNGVIRYVLEEGYLYPLKHLCLILLTLSILRYKAEVDVDGRELALYYLRKKNLRSMLDEVNAMKTEQELETFLLQHGENIVDCLGEQVFSLVTVEMSFFENIFFPFTFRLIELR